MHFEPKPSCPTMLERALSALEGGASAPRLVDDLYAWLSRYRSYTEGEIRIALMPGLVRALAIRGWRGAHVVPQPMSHSFIVTMGRGWAIKRRRFLAERLASTKCQPRRQVAEVFTKLSVALELEAGNVVGDLLIDLSPFALEIIERDFDVEFPKVEEAERRITVSAPADEVWEMLNALQDRYDSYEGGELRSMMSLRKRLLAAKQSVAESRR